MGEGDRKDILSYNYDKNYELDYSKYSDIFDNLPVRQGPQFSELDEDRREYAIRNALNYKYEPQIPEIAGLTKTDFWKVVDS